MARYYKSRVLATCHSPHVHLSFVHCNIKYMNLSEENHTPAAEPPFVPASGLASAAGDHLFSTKLLENSRASTSSEASSSSWLKTIRDRAITPTKEKLSRVDVGPVMDTLFGVPTQSRQLLSPVQPLPRPATRPSRPRQANHPSNRTLSELPPAMAELRKKF